MSYIGKSVPRREDKRLLTGKARFIADMKFPGLLYARVMRSPVAHARIRSVDTRAAAQLPGVADVISGTDTRHLRFFNNRHTMWPRGDIAVFMNDKVRFVGDEVAAVAATDPFIAQDAIELIDVAYEELPVVLDAERALLPDSPLVHDELANEGIIQGNLLASKMIRAGDIRKAEAQADVIVSGRFYCNRPVCNPLETHGTIAIWDSAAGELSVWSSTQAVNIVRDGLADVLGLSPSRIRVIAPDVGGGFGAKVGLFSHEIITAVLAMRTGRPVKLILDRSEELSSVTSRCAQTRYAELMLKKDGEFVGWRERVIQDQGAYAYSGLSVLQMGSQLGILPYRFPHIEIEALCVYTNKNSGAAYRAYGVPQAAFARDSLVHMAAKKLGCTPEHLMRRNIVKGEECPTTMALGQVIDSTGIDLCLEKVIAEVDRLGWRHQLKEYRGIGFSTTLKHSSCRHPRMDYDHDSVRISLDADGGATVVTATCPQGQGIYTVLAQIAAEHLGLSIEKVKVTGGDSSGPRGLGTWGSRTITITGNAIVRACDAIKRKIAAVAAHALEVEATNLVFADDLVSVGGQSNKNISIKEVVRRCERSRGDLPPGMEAGPIDVTASYDSPTTNPDANGCGNMTMTHSGAAHACFLEVDPGTGKVTILGYVMAEDSGVAVNPLLVEGQQQGAVAMALGQILYEGLVYDDSGQLLNGNFRDYYTPLATDIPNLSMVHDCGVPSTSTLFGQRGAGESGNVPPMAAVANAISDAIGVRLTEMPITPEKILFALRGIKSSSLPIH